MNEFGGQRTVGRQLARKGKLLAAAVAICVVLTACGGGDDSSAIASTGVRGTPPSSGVPSNPGGTPTSPGGALADSGGSPSDLGGAPSGSGGAPTGVDTVPPLSEEGAGSEAGTGSVTLSWIPPTMNDDGSPLKLTGYRIYWGPSKDNLTNSVVVDNPGLTRYVVEQLKAGTYYFVATALSGDRESEYSNVFSMTID